jgi:cytochrome c oxidase subunit IV
MGTHKGKGEDINWIISVYYNFPGALFALCFCSEVTSTQGFVVCSYLSYFYEFSGMLHLAHIVAFATLAAGLFLKQVVNVVQFTDSVARLMQRETKAD